MGRRLDMDYDGYQFLRVVFTMRDCNSVEDAIKKCSDLLPHHPDDNCVFMESWEILEETALENEKSKWKGGK